MYVDPCELDDCFDPGAIGWLPWLFSWRWFKTLLTALLLLLAIILLLRACASVAPPVVTVPAAEILAGDYELNGTAGPGANLRVIRDGQTLGNTRANAAGNWSYTATYEPGEYSVKADMINNDILTGESVLAAGATGLLTALALPTLDFPGGDVDPGTIALNGTGTPGSQLEILSNGAVLDTLTVGSDGTWTYDTDVVGGESYDYAARLIDSSGGELGQTGSVTVSAAEMMAEEPAITSGTAELALDGDPQLGLFGLLAGATGLASGPLELSGTGEPGSTIQLFNGDTLLGETTVGSDGTWLFDGDVELPVGESELAVQMLDASGANIGRSTPFPITLALGAAAPAIGDVSFDDDGGLNLSGTGEPGGEVEIFINGESAGTAVVDENETWIFPRVLLSSGEYEFVARSIDADGNAVDSDPVSAAFAPSGDAVGFTIGNLIAGESGQVSMTGTGAPGGLITLFLNGEPFATVEPDADGSWSFDGFLPASSYTVTAVQTLDGQDSDESAGLDFEISLPDGAASFNGDAGTGSLLLNLPTGSSAAGSGDGSEGEDGDGSSAAEFLDRPTVSLILDASWSMTFPLDSSEEADRLTADDPDSRIAIAKSSLLDFVENNLLEGDPVTLRAFGNIEGNLACRTDLMYSLQPADPDEVAGVISGINPQFNANTAIAASLAAVGSDLSGAADDSERIIVLLTDGGETCGGDPAAEIQSLADSGFDVTVNIIGFAIADVALQNTFEEWAALGNGTYYDAQDASALIDALERATNVRYDILDSDGNLVGQGVFGNPFDGLEPGLYTIRIENSAGDEVVYQNVVVSDSKVTELELVTE
ncbi:MAG: hypothetical protein AAF633_00005 [Chloroflexota bacterium]